MPIIRKPGEARRSAAVVASNAAKKADEGTKKAEKGKAKARLKALDDYLKINNPNAKQNADQITLLTNAVLELVKGA